MVRTDGAVVFSSPDHCALAAPLAALAAMIAVNSLMIAPVLAAPALVLPRGYALLACGLLLTALPLRWCLRRRRLRHVLIVEPDGSLRCGVISGDQTPALVSGPGSWRVCNQRLLVVWGTRSTHRSAAVCWFDRGGYVLALSRRQAEIDGYLQSLPPPLRATVPPCEETVRLPFM